MAVFDDPQGRGRTGSRPRRRVMSGTPRSRATTSRRSTRRPPRRRSVRRRPRIRVPPRLVRQSRADLVSDGTRARWASMTQRPASGANGSYRQGSQAYAVYVDDRDIVWLTDFGANAIVRFDPSTERFDPSRYQPTAPRFANSTAARRALGRRVGPRQAGCRDWGLSGNVERGRVDGELTLNPSKRPLAPHPWHLDGLRVRSCKKPDGGRPASSLGSVVVQLQRWCYRSSGTCSSCRCGP
jgi:hypothetical protein